MFIYARLMNTINLVQRSKEIPETVPDILKQIAEMRPARGGTTDVLEEKLRSLFADELEPRSMFLLVRELSDGRIRFIIKDSATNSFIHMLECA